MFFPERYKKFQETDKIYNTMILTTDFDFVS